MTWVRRLLRFLKWTFLALTGVLVVGYVVLGLCNLNDQPPSERVLELRRQFAARAAVPDERNGFVYLMGFTVRKGGDPLAEGRKQMAALRRLQSDAQMAIDELPDTPELSLGTTRCCDIETLSDTCNLAEADCLLVLSRSLAQLRQWVQEEKWLLDRYRGLIAMPDWQDPIPMDLLGPWPRYSELGEGQKLLLAQALLLADDGQVAAARALLEADARFWRRILANTEYAIMKLVATSSVQRHLQWTSLISRRLPPEQMHAVVAQQWQAPLSREELAMRRVLNGEWAFMDRLVHDMERDNPRVRVPGDKDFAYWEGFISSGLQRPLWQPQDASNHHAELLGRLADVLDRTNPENISAIFAQARDIEESTHREFSRLQPYNLVHRLVLRESPAYFHTYWARTADLEGLRRALLLTIELRRSAIASPGVGKALQESAWRNPYTRAPFEWDDHAGAIVFTGMTQGERGRYALPY